MGFVNIPPPINETELSPEYWYALGWAHREAGLLPLSRDEILTGIENPSRYANAYYAGYEDCAYALLTRARRGEEAEGEFSPP